MKIKIIDFVALGILVLMIAACGGTSATDSERQISGEIEFDVAAATVKSTQTDSCVGPVCGVTAYSSEGGETEGVIDPATHRFRIRVRHGNWMFGFLDGSGQRLGYLALNGITSVTIEEGDDVDLGKVRLQDRLMLMLQDMEHLGENGIYGYYGQDMDRDGVPQAFGDDEELYDSLEFTLLFIRPFDEQPHVAPCRPIKLVFNEAVDENTVSSETLKVGLEDGSPIEGEIAVWTDSEYNEYEVVFAPVGGYPMGAVIYVTVAGGPDGILSAEGEALEGDVNTSFAVRDFGGTSIICHDPDEERHRIRTQEREQNRQGQTD